MTNVEVINLINESENELKSKFKKLEDVAFLNQKKVLNAFRNNEVQARHLVGTTGYGYDDIGRDTLCKLYANIFHCDSAIVSPLIVSGTHALTLMLFGILRPNDKFISVSGKPYDTLQDVILAKNKGSLSDFGVKFDIIELKEDNSQVDFDYEAIKNTLTNELIKAVFVTRSRGYSLRAAISVEKIEKLIKFVKKLSPNTIIIVDNNYGEFVEEIEPTDVGADIMAGSLIKNIGGGLAPTGGYIAGRSDLVEQVSYRLTAPSLGMEEGSYAYGYQNYYQGLFMAPSIVKNALKGSLLFAKTYSKIGFETLPNDNIEQYDIVTSIKLKSAENLINFCGAIQEVSPIDSNVKPVPWAMPGYQDEVIMAAGTFVQGASIELSADGPVKDPYIVYIQGGLTYEHAKMAVEHTLMTIK